MTERKRKKTAYVGEWISGKWVCTEGVEKVVECRRIRGEEKGSCG